MTDVMASQPPTKPKAHVLAEVVDYLATALTVMKASDYRERASSEFEYYNDWVTVRNKIRRNTGALSPRDLRLLEQVTAECTWADLRGRAYNDDTKQGVTWTVTKLLVAAIVDLRVLIFGDLECWSSEADVARYDPATWKSQAVNRMDKTAVDEEVVAALKRAGKACSGLGPQRACLFAGFYFGDIDVEFQVEESTD